MPGYFAGLFLSGNVWPGDVRFHTRSFESQLAEEDYLLLRYESLIKNPKTKVSRLFDPESMSRGGVPPSREHVVRKEWAGSYKEFLGESLLETVEESLKEYLKQYGYIQGNPD